MTASGIVFMIVVFVLLFLLLYAAACISEREKADKRAAEEFHLQVIEDVVRAKVRMEEEKANDQTFEDGLGI